MCDKVGSPLGSKMFYIWQKQRLKMIWYTHEKHNEPVLCLIFHLLGNSLIHTLHHSDALSLMLDRFQTNNMLTCSHRLLYNNLAWHTCVSCWVTCTVIWHCSWQISKIERNCNWFKLFKMSCFTCSNSLSIGTY